MRLAALLLAALTLTVAGCVAPACPENLEGRANRDGSITLDWDSSPDATHYRIERAVGDGDFDPAYAFVPEPQTGFTDFNTTERETYRYRVVAGNGLEEAQLCDVVEVTAIPELPTTMAVAVAVAGGVAALAVVRRRP